MPSFLTKAVHLLKDYRFEADEVIVTKLDEMVILLPLEISIIRGRSSKAFK